MNCPDGALAREHHPRSRWAKGWGEGQTATQVHLHHTSQEEMGKDVVNRADRKRRHGPQPVPPGV